MHNWCGCDVGTSGIHVAEIENRKSIAATVPRVKCVPQNWSSILPIAHAFGRREWNSLWTQMKYLLMCLPGCLHNSNMTSGTFVFCAACGLCENKIRSNMILVKYTYFFFSACSSFRHTTRNIFGAGTSAVRATGVLFWNITYILFEFF